MIYLGLFLVFIMLIGIFVYVKLQNKETAMEIELKTKTENLQDRMNEREEIIIKMEQSDMTKEEADKYITDLAKIEDEIAELQQDEEIEIQYQENIEEDTETQPEEIDISFGEDVGEEYEEEVVYVDEEGNEVTDLDGEYEYEEEYVYVEDEPYEEEEIYEEYEEETTYEEPVTESETDDWVESTEEQETGSGGSINLGDILEDTLDVSEEEDTEESPEVEPEGVQEEVESVNIFDLMEEEEEEEEEVSLVDQLLEEVGNEEDEVYSDVAEYTDEETVSRVQEIDEAEALKQLESEMNEREELEKESALVTPMQMIEKPYEPEFDLRELEDYIKSEDKIYYMEIINDDEKVFTWYINTSYLVALFGRHLYGGETRVERLTSIPDTLEHIEPYNGEKREDGVEYNLPCKEIGLEEYRNSFAMVYKRMNHLMNHIIKYIRTETPTIKESLNRGSGKYIGSIGEYFYLHLITDLVNNKLGEQEKADRHEIYDDMTKSLYDEYGQSNYLINFRIVTDETEVRNRGYFGDIEIDNWVSAYKDDMDTFIEMKDIVRQINDKVNMYREMESEEDETKKKQIQERVITYFHSLTGLEGDITEQELMNEVIFIQQGIINMVSSYRKKLCLMGNYRQNISENSVASVNLNDELMS